MGVIHKLGWSVARHLAKSMSPYHVRRMAALFAEHGRPANERQSYVCPNCGHEGPMEPFFGSGAMRFDAQCPKCHSRERHRFLRHWMEADPRGANFGSLLHFAPEPELQVALKDRSEIYRTADITPGRADLVLNMEDIDLPDGSVDTIMANHVLEHVDDSKALPEMYRILKPGGFAVLTVPVVTSWDTSYEDGSITDKTQRFIHFGQEDHVRYFGRDIENRIRAAGFDLDVITSDGATSAKYALIPGDTIYVATHPKAAAKPN